MTRYRLGQSAIVDQAAKQVIIQAEPVVRRIVSEERARVARAVKNAIPYVGASAASLIGTRYLVSEKNRTAKGAGYIASAALAAAGVWSAMDTVSEGQEEQHVREVTPSGLTALTQPVADQFAQAVLTEAEPRVRDLVQQEKERLAAVAGSALPWTAGALAAFLGTAFLVPETSNIGKMAGYTVSTALFLGGLWSALGKAE